MVRVQRDELEIGPPPMVVTMVGGRAKEAQPWKFNPRLEPSLPGAWVQFELPPRFSPNRGSCIIASLCLLFLLHRCLGCWLLHYLGDLLSRFLLWVASCCDLFFREDSSSMWIIFHLSTASTWNSSL